MGWSQFDKRMKIKVGKSGDPPDRWYYTFEQKDQWCHYFPWEVPMLKKEISFLYRALAKTFPEDLV